MDNPRFERYITSPPRKPGKWETRARKLCDELAQKIGLRQLKPRTALAAAALFAVVAGFGLAHSGVFRVSEPATPTDSRDAAPATVDEAPAAETTVTVHVVIDQGGEVVASAGDAAGTSGGGTSGVSNDGRINLNTADAQTLEGLPGVGPATAQKIIADRSSNGPFKSPEDLMRVSGIGPKKYDAVKDLITVR